MGTISVKLPAQLEAKLDASVAKHRTTRSRYLRSIIEAHLEATSDHMRSSALVRAGKLVGCLGPAPADLSTNPKYLKGYGT